MRSGLVAVWLLVSAYASANFRERLERRDEEVLRHQGESGKLGDEMWASTVGMAHALLEESHPKAAAHMLAKHGFTKQALRHLISCGSHQHAKELAWHSGADVEYQLAKELAKQPRSWVEYQLAKELLKRPKRLVEGTNPPSTSWHSFGKTSVCRVDQDDVSTDGQGTAQRMNASSLAECKKLCVQAVSCTGVEHERRTGNCRLWTIPIGFSRSRWGWECLALTRHKAGSTLKGFQPVFRHAMPAATNPGYTDAGRGKCLALNKDPVYSYFSGKGDQCRRMCDESTTCYGYSVSIYSNCLLWEQPHLARGGVEWGDAHCFIKNVEGRQGSTATFVVDINLKSYAAAKDSCRSQGLAIASAHGKHEEKVIAKLIAEAGEDCAFVEQGGIGRLLCVPSSLPERHKGIQEEEKRAASICEGRDSGGRLNPQVFRFV